MHSTECDQSRDRDGTPRWCSGKNHAIALVARILLVVGRRVRCAERASGLRSLIQEPLQDDLRRHCIVYGLVLFPRKFRLSEQLVGGK